MALDVDHLDLVWIRWNGREQDSPGQALRNGMVVTAG